MSFSCPFDAPNAAKPCENDLAVEILREIFGADFVNAFLSGSQSPAMVTLTEPTILSLALSSLATIAITAAILIFVVSIYKWVTESANDGEAVGLTERGGLLGMFGRPLYSLALLVPTASGYPLICVISMTVILWANGATNQLYEKISMKTINVSSTDPNVAKNPAFIQANDVTDSYVMGLSQGYCLRQLHNADPKTNIRAIVDKVEGGMKGAAAYKLSYRDSKGTYADKGSDVCGTFQSQAVTEKSFLADPSNKLANSDLIKDINAIQKLQVSPLVNVINLRREYAALAYFQGLNKSLGTNDLSQIFGTASSTAISQRVLRDGDTVLGRSTLQNTAGWDVNMAGDTVSTPINMKTLLSEAQSYSDALNAAATKELEDNLAKQGSNYNQQIAYHSQRIKDSLLSTGWMNAGNSQSTLRQLRGSLTNNLVMMPVDTHYNAVFIADDEDKEESTKQIYNAMKNAAEGINRGVERYLPRDHPARVTLASQTIMSSAASGGSPDDAVSGMASTLGAPWHSLNERVVSIIVDGKDEADTLTRIQSLGESILLMISLTAIAIGVITTGLEMAVVAGKTASGASFGILKGAAAFAESARNLATKLLLDPARDLIDSFFMLSRIFGVVIPSMPYIFLILAGVGWFIQIIQTMFGMPLWLIMHSIPEKSFIGSQQQGYVTLLSLLFRPILIISGFFLAFALYDPLIVYATRAFFDSYGTISGASSSHGATEFLIYLSSLKYWYYLYAGVLMGITYLVFGLVQELSDSVLDWLGTNLLRGFGNMNSDAMLKGAAAGMASSAAAQSRRREQTGGGSKTDGGTGNDGQGDNKPNGDGDGDGDKARGSNDARNIHGQGDGDTDVTTTGAAGTTVGDSENDADGSGDSKLSAANLSANDDQNNLQFEDGDESVINDQAESDMVGDQDQPDGAALNADGAGKTDDSDENVVGTQSSVGGGADDAISSGSSSSGADDAISSGSSSSGADGATSSGSSSNVASSGGSSVDSKTSPNSDAKGSVAGTSKGANVKANPKNRSLGGKFATIGGAVALGTLAGGVRAATGNGLGVRELMSAANGYAARAEAADREALQQAQSEATSDQGSVDGDVSQNTDDQASNLDEDSDEDSVTPNEAPANDGFGSGANLSNIYDGTTASGSASNASAPSPAGGQDNAVNNGGSSLDIADNAAGSQLATGLAAGAGVAALAASKQAGGANSVTGAGKGSSSSTPRPLLSSSNAKLKVGASNNAGKSAINATNLGSDGKISASGTISENGYAVKLSRSNSDGSGRVNVGEEVLDIADDGSSVLHSNVDGVVKQVATNANGAVVSSFAASPSNADSTSGFAGSSTEVNYDASSGQNSALNSEINTPNQSTLNTFDSTNNSVTSQTQTYSNGKPLGNANTATYQNAALNQNGQVINAAGAGVQNIAKASATGAGFAALNNAAKNPNAANVGIMAAGASSANFAVSDSNANGSKAVVATGLGSGNLSAQGQITDNGYSVDISRNTNGVQQKVGSESMSVANDGQITTNTTLNGLNKTVTQAPDGAVTTVSASNASSNQRSQVQFANSPSSSSQGSGFAAQSTFINGGQTTQNVFDAANNSVVSTISRNQRQGDGSFKPVVQSTVITPNARLNSNGNVVSATSTAAPTASQRPAAPMGGGRSVDMGSIGNAQYTSAPNAQSATSTAAPTAPQRLAPTPAVGGSQSNTPLQTSHVRSGQSAPIANNVVDMRSYAETRQQSQQAQPRRMMPLRQYNTAVGGGLVSSLAPISQSSVPSPSNTATHSQRFTPVVVASDDLTRTGANINVLDRFDEDEADSVLTTNTTPRVSDDN